MSMINCRVNGRWDILLPEHRKDIWGREEGWEKPRLESMHKHLGKDDVLYYIGAEEGDMPALCQMWGARVVMFEPDYKVWANIKAIWKANKLEDPWCWAGFASDKNSGMALYKGFYKFKGEIITDHGFMELRNRNAPEITVDKLNDDLSYNHGLKITALSLDVEGSEWLVLKGAEKTLREYHPKIWLSVHPEIMLDHFGQKQEEMRKWIKSLGYKETFLENDHEIHLFYENGVKKASKDLDLK